MTHPGAVVLVQFPFSDQQQTKYRPVLVISRIPGPYDDWLVAMISSELRHEVVEFDERLTQDDIDFENSGLRYPSLIRIARLAVVSEKNLIGLMGTISENRLSRIRKRLAFWLSA